MTPEERAEARRLANAATPGPWLWAHIVDGIEARAIIDAHGYHFARVDDIENGIFIAASRTLVPQLLDALEAAEREHAECKDCQPLGHSRQDVADMLVERDTARARLAEVERERDEVRTYITCQCGDDEACRFVQERDTARAQVAALTEALREIAEDAGPSAERTIARAALKAAGVET